MIQEFIISGVMEDKKLSIIGKGPLSDSTSPFLSTSTTSATTTTAEPPPQNLRCPRCDSSNTKFCYYNNYNLTQPRHFCKTCRRYWTKGGALRNIPIGGSCRKAKPSPAISSAATAKPAASNPIPIARAALEPDPEPEIPTLWAAPAPPHTSHLLALLRASGIGGIQYPNTSTLHCLNPIKSKEEAMAAEPARGCGMGFSGLSLDPLGQFSTAAGIGSLWRNEGQLPYMQNPVPLQAENNPPFGDAVAGVQDLYQMLRLPAMATAYCSGWSAPASSALATAASVAGGGGGGDGAGAAATALEASLRGEFGNWNPALAWSDMSTIN